MLPFESKIHQKKQRFPASCYSLDGRNPANQLIDSLYHYFQGFIQVVSRISSINSTADAQTNRRETNKVEMVQTEDPKALVNTFFETNSENPENVCCWSIDPFLSGQ